MRGSVLVGVAVALFVAGAGLIAAYFALGDESGKRAEAAAEPARGPTSPAIDPAEFLGRTVTLRTDAGEFATTWAELGFVADPALVDTAIVAVAAPPEALAAAVDKVKRNLDQSPRNARLDLDARKIHPHEDGRLIDLYGATAALEAGARNGASAVVLPTVIAPAEITTAELGINDISHVLATFTTKFSIAEKSRNFNLKNAASKLHGHILKPGEIFSFNDVVGARTEKEGYKIAHVIQGGEMVDGQAGGTCQISTTLHGAAFFAGLEIIKGRPHSRPSTYVQMGLDATVVYPHADVKLRNNYDFPVVISYRVARGESQVEILGQARPFDKIAFEREVLERIDFDTVTREDYEMPIGHMVVDQLGFPGYKVQRYRKYYQDGEVVKTDRWKLEYKPVTEYVRTGANPDPNLPAPPTRKLHGPKPPSSDSYRLVQ